MEEAEQYTSSSKSDFSCKYHHLCVGGKQESITGRKEESSPSILKASIAVTIPIATAHARLKTSWEVSVHLKGASGRLRSARQLQSAGLRNHLRDLGVFKRMATLVIVEVKF